MTTMSGARLRRNVGLNLMGYLLPLVAALAAVPVLLDRLGPDRFGLVALAWTLVGAVAVLDLGTSRAVTKLVAECLGRGDAERLPPLTGTAAALALTVGVVGALLLVAVAPWLCTSVLQVPPELLDEAVAGFRILALVIPGVLAGNALRGVLEASQQFGRVTAVRASVGTLLVVGPALVVLVVPTVVAVVWVLVAVRTTGSVVYAVLAARQVRLPWTATVDELRALLRLGGWMTVSSVLATVLLYADRFVIGARVSLEAVAWYAAPLEVIQRLSVVPAAIMGVMFPAFSTRLAEPGGDVRGVFHRSRWVILALVVPPVVVLIVAARPLLELWLGPEAAANSAPVAAILAAGVLAHAVAQPSFNLLQAAGRPELPARLHLVEAPTYLAYLMWLTDRFGIVGSAVAWTVRVTLSMLVLGWMARRVVLDRLPEGPASGAVE